MSDSSEFSLVQCLAHTKWVILVYCIWKSVEWLIRLWETVVHIGIRQRRESNTELIDTLGLSQVFAFLVLPAAFFRTVALYCSELQWADFLRILPWMLHSLRAEIVLCLPFYPSAQHDFWLHSKHSGNICLVNKWEKIKYSYPFMHLLFLFGFCISHLTR